MGLFRGRQRAGSPRHASVEGWHVSRLPPLSCQPPDATMGSGGVEEGSGGRTYSHSALPANRGQPTPRLLPCFLRELVAVAPWVTETTLLVPKQEEESLQAEAGQG